MSDNNNWRLQFEQMYKPLLNDKYDEFEQSLSTLKKKHFRLNTTRGIDYLSELSKVSTYENLDGYRDIFKVIDGEQNLTNTLSFQTGGFYIMNPSSVVPAQLLASYMPEKPVMLDVSAAPGGKTCALSDFTNRKGIIVANEISSNRLKSLHFNLEKHGCYNVRTVSYDGRLLGDMFVDTFDGILLDAPCSNENKIFRNKTVQSQWGKDLIERMATLQYQLLKSAFKALKQGGVLAYSTCTLSLEENELAVKYVLDNIEGVELLKAGEFAGGGLSGISNIDENVARIMPDMHSIDGFFVALFRKCGDLQENSFNNPTLSTKAIDFFHKNTINIPSDINIFETESRGYMETSGGLFDKVRFKRRGLNIYRVAGKELEPTCQLIWEFGGDIPNDTRINISHEQAIKYLQGFDIDKKVDTKSAILFCDEVPIGYAKNVNDILKNKLDRYFLYGKNIEW